MCLRVKDGGYAHLVTNIGFIPLRDSIPVEGISEPAGKHSRVLGVFVFR